MAVGLTAVRQMRPQAYDALDRALAQAYAACPPGLLDLCRARVRMLLGSSDNVPAGNAQLDALADYPRSALFSDLERSALEFTEQYVMDVASMPDDLVRRLGEHLGPAGLYAFAMGLYAVDQAERLDLTAALHPDGDL